MKGGLNLVNGDNVIKFPKAPLALAEAPVYDLNAMRQSHDHQTGSADAPQMAPKCANGVCMFEWKPKKPAA